MHQCHVKCACVIPPRLCCTVIIVFPFIFVPSGRLHLTVWLLASVCLSILISSIISALLPRMREVGESLLYRPISSALTLTAAALLTFWCVLLESLCASGNDMPMASCFSLYYHFFDFYSSLTCCRVLYEEIESWVHFFTKQLFSMQVIAIDEKRTRTRVISGDMVEENEREQGSLWYTERKRLTAEQWIATRWIATPKYVLGWIAGKNYAK